MKRMFQGIPANPMTALQQYYNEKDAKEGDTFTHHKGAIGKVVDVVEVCVEHVSIRNIYVTQKPATSVCRR